MNGMYLLDAAPESWAVDELNDEADRLQDVVADCILRRVRGGCGKVWKPTDVGDVLIDALLTIGFDWDQDDRLERIKSYLVQTYVTAQQILPARLREF
jgi:hypothetical protein